MQHLWSFSNTYHNHPKIKRSAFQMKPDLKCDPEIQIQRFLSYYFHNNWTWFTEQKGFPPSVTLLKTSPDCFCFRILHFHALSQLEIYNSLRANYVSLFVSIPRFLHIMITAMLVLETLVFNKLKSTCLIGTSVIEQYSLSVRSWKNTD